MLHCYKPKRFGAAALRTIEQANEIIDEYADMDIQLTLRQLYYQFVSRDLIPNSEKSYKALGGVVSDGRLAGLIDWEAIEDRGRELKDQPYWDSVRSYCYSSPRWYFTDLWADQPRRVEVWIEKEALTSVIVNVCEELRVPYFACKGYNSQSEAWRAGQRMEGYIADGQEPLVIHLGDHDPSGIDMTRDNLERLAMFAGEHVQVERIALNIDQVRRYNPPPNPTKLGDSRSSDYVSKYGHTSWELDALEPRVIVQLVRDAILEARDERIWKASVKKMEKDRERIQEIMDNLPED